MNGIPPVLSLRPDTREAEAFIRMMLASVTPGPAMRPERPASGWLDAYRCTRCAACGSGVVIGSRCRQCGGPR